MADEPQSGDHAAVVDAVLDYFEGWFTGDAARMERALHAGLAKRALEGDGWSLDETTCEWMINATAEGIGRGQSREDNQIKVIVEDIHKTIANVTVRSAIYREYVQLALTSHGWKIINTLYEPS